MLTKLRLLTAGESHGPRLNGVLDGMPAGLKLDADAIATMMARRQKGYGAGGRMKIERDRLVLTGGYMGGRRRVGRWRWKLAIATGRVGPIAMWRP